MASRTLMLQGTSSSVGKSLLTTAICRLFARQGVRVAPFKAQNMSNNSAVCADGSEIGRAQALQALAAGTPATADMNPVLLKPEGDSRSQVVVHGRVWQTLAANNYHERKQHLWQAVTESLDRLRSQFDLVVIEGAGSPVELNLKAGDIVNMAVARYLQCPVLLVGNIDVGGIFAQMLGTLDLLDPEERQLIRGLIVNRFRGDPDLFVDGVRILEERGGVPVLGVMPFLPHLGLPEEDAVALETGDLESGDAGAIDIAVIRLPRISNFDDFDPLRREAGVRVRYVESLSHLGQPHAIVLPGTKNTAADLLWLRNTSLAEAVIQRAKQGVAIVGICGGYQMLGRVIRDPQQVETNTQELPGLGLLEVQTTFLPEKATYQVQATVQPRSLERAHLGWLADLSGCRLTGYEIHMGQTEANTPWLTIADRNGKPCAVQDGSVAHQGHVWGCYLHGLFANDDFRRAWLSSLVSSFTPHTGTGADAEVQAALDRLAAAFATAVPFEKLENIVQNGVTRP